MAAIFFLLDDDELDVVALRNHILAPLNRQMQRVAESRRRQRRVTDVDPTSGAEVFDDAPVHDVEVGDISQPTTV